MKNSTKKIERFVKNKKDSPVNVIDVRNSHFMENSMKKSLDSLKTEDSLVNVASIGLRIVALWKIRSKIRPIRRKRRISSFDAVPVENSTKKFVGNEESTRSTMHGKLDEKEQWPRRKSGKRIAGFVENRNERNSLARYRTVSLFVLRSPFYFPEFFNLLHGCIILRVIRCMQNIRLF